MKKTEWMRLEKVVRYVEVEGDAKSMATVSLTLSAGALVSLWFLNVYLAGFFLLLSMIVIAAVLAAMREVRYVLRK